MATACCQRLATAATLLGKELRCPARRWAPQTPLHAFGLVERENERVDFASQRDKRLITIVCLTN